MSKWLTRMMLGILAGNIFLLPGYVQAEELIDYTLDPVYVTATRYEKQDLKIPAATEVFTSEQLEKLNAKSVMEVIQNIPGFVISESPSGNGNPGLRGISGHLSIMINGIPLAKDYYFQMGTLSTAGIERIEVIKGGSAVLYGSNATTGVINIITKKDGANKLAVGYGDHRQRSLSGFVNGKGLSVSYDYYDTKDAGLVYDSSTQYFRKYLRRHSVAVQYDPNEHWNLMYLYNDKDNECARLVKSTGKYTKPWRNITDYGMLQGTYKNKDLRLLTYFQNRQWHSDLGGSINIQRGNYYGLDVQNKWKFPGTSLTAGGTYEMERSKQQARGIWKDQGRNHGSAFFLTETPLSKKTDLYLGSREVFTGDSGDVFCPQLQILHKLSDKESLYMNVNKSLLEPALSQRYGYSDAQVPNPDLKAEKAWTYEAGWKKKLSKESLLKFDVYHMEISDRIYSVRLKNGTSTYRNALKYRNTGAELSYEYQVPKGFSYSVGVSYGNPEQILTSDGDWERAENRLGLNATLGYNLGKTSFNVFANYAGERVNDTSSMISVDVDLQQRLTAKDKLSLKVGNILNRHDFRSSNGGSVLQERNCMLTYERSF